MPILEFTHLYIQSLFQFSPLNFGSVSIYILQVKIKTYSNFF